ncbi:hypothetical protein IWW54_006038 [Coemansia sp. RSA 2705]|nr:hypothetical protein IWW54_006038 [Coemansia sp. RSA 2705]
MLLTTRTIAAALRPATLRAARSKSTTSALAPVPGLDLSNERLRRAVFYVPCSEERKIQKSLGSAADCVMYDLEDGVSLNRKGHARGLVLSALAGSRARSRGVRINSLGSGFEMDDLNVVLQSDALDVIMVPKVERAADVHFVQRLIEGSKARDRVTIIAGIETARGLVNIQEIARADRVDALLFAAEDYCADTGIVRTPGRRELHYARSVVSTTAHAFRLQAIDMVTMDFRNAEVLREEAREGAEMGFTGKQVIHPAQVDDVQQSFMPTAEARARAVRIVRGYQQHYALGKGAFDLDGKAIDMPVVKWAYRMLRRAELAGVDVAAELNE